MALPEYEVLRISEFESSAGEIDWNGIPAVRVENFHPAGSDHRPAVEARLAYDELGLRGRFDVMDRYVVCTHVSYGSHAYKDSCVEFFVRPKPALGYFNFEMSCGGGLLLYYISDWTRKAHPEDPDDEFSAFVKIPPEVGTQVRLRPSMPGPLRPESTGPLAWSIEFDIPFGVLETYVGPLGALPGQVWRANFNKCADESSHPHWATWAPIGELLDLHQPDRFGVLRFR